MTQGTRRLFIAIIAGMVALALGAGAVRPAPARAASSALGTYVALGDSYSSGDGVPANLNAVCHQSSSAWPAIVSRDLGFSGSQFIFRACTGSKLTDPNGSKAVNGFPLGDLTGTEQVPDAVGLIVGTWPAQEYADSAGNPSLTPDTRLVTLTWGGNDVGFGQVLIDCIVNPVCPATEGQQLDNNIATIGNTLVKAYEEIARLAPYARIIVMGYPRWFPNVPPPLCDPVALRVLWMNQEIQNLDTAIQAAVTIAYQAGVKHIEYVSGSYDAFTGHELCTASPYLNGVMPFYLIASFHPNGAGNDRMAQLAEQAAIAAIVPVPNVVGLPAAAAVSAIRSAGLVPIEVSFVDTTCNNIGYVMNQSPRVGLPIGAGSPVTITVGTKPPNPCP
jgi:hypothetical protein